MTFRLFSVLLLGLCAVPGLIAAQTKEPVMFRVFYEMKHIQDLDRPDNPHVERMLLVASPSSAIFSSYDRILQGQRTQQQLEAHSAMYKGTISPPLMVQGLRDVSPFDLYFFASEQKFFVLENLIVNYLYEEKYPTINWEIQEETKTIQGISCQKAVAQYKGRQWQVWFTDQIPIPFGPWELGGLPGLIVEASDAREEVVFSFDGFETIDQGEESTDKSLEPGRYGINTMEAKWIALPTQKITAVKKAERDRIKNAAVKNHLQFFKMQMKTTGNFTHNDSVRPNSWSQEIKNPIALLD